MKALLKAVRSALEESGGLSGAVSGIFAGRAPGDAAMPYLVWNVRGSTAPGRDTGGQVLERVTLTFEAYSAGAAAAAGAVEAAEMLFAAQAPELESGALVQVRKTAGGMTTERRLDGAGDEIWRGRLDMEFLIQREQTV